MGFSKTESPQKNKSNYHSSGTPITNNLSNWTMRNGDFNITTEGIFVKSYKSNPQIFMPVDKNSDFEFMATLRNVKGFHWAGLLAKSTVKLIVNNESGRLELYRKQETKWDMAASADKYMLYTSDRESFRIRLVCVNDSLFGYIDDKKLISYKNNLPMSSDGLQCGLISGWKTNIAWKDIVLNELSADAFVKGKQNQIKAENRFVEVLNVQGLRDNNIYYDDEEAGFVFRVKSKSLKKNSIVIKLGLIDVHEQVMSERVIEDAFLLHDEFDLRVKFKPERRGCFKVALYAGNHKDNLEWVEDLGSFSVLPKLDSSIDVSKSYFGGHIDGINAAWHLEGAKKLGINLFRAHDGIQAGWWTRVQPDGPEQWLWPYDNILDLINEGGGKTLGVLLWIPKWATGKNPANESQNHLAPIDWDAFRRFVRNVVLHNKTRIQYWEVWNEPHYRLFWKGSPEQYAKLLKEAYNAIHEIDSDALVIGAGGISAKKIQWIERMLKAGAGENMDCFSIHYLQPENAEQDMRALRSILKKYSVDVPIWNTEDSVPSTSFLDQVRWGDNEPNARYHFRNACYELVKMYMRNISNGVERIFYYHQFDPWRFGKHNKPRTEVTRITTGMWDEGQMLKPIAAAHAALMYATQGMRYRTRLNSGEINAYIFENDNSATAVLYAEYRNYIETRKYSFVLSGVNAVDNFKVIDFMGNESILSAASYDNLAITLEPRYLVYRGEKGGAYLEKILSQAFNLVKDQ